MNKKLTRTLAIALAATMLLGGCGAGGDQGSAEEGSASTQGDNKNALKDLVLPMQATRELETFNILYSQRLEDTENLTNLIDGLLEVDTEGKLKPAIAESWETTDGGLTWTFKIREGVKWVNVNGEEKADCTAQDFATGLEWILNFHKNSSSNTAMPCEMIKGATEYYEWTKTLSEEEALALNGSEGSKFREMVGLETPDDYTLVYHCVAEKPYFDTLATYVCLYPMAQGMIDELGGAAGVKSMNNETMWCNGAYTMTSYIQGNEKIYTKNPLYWDKECSLFDTVTMKMVESSDVTLQLYENGDVDTTGLTESMLATIAGDENHKFHDYIVPATPSKYSYQWHFNYNKKNADGTPDVNWNTAIANEAFRKSLYWGLDMTPNLARTNTLDPVSCENNFYSMKGLCHTSDGKDYTELVREKLGLPADNGETVIRYNKEKGEQYKKQAIEELTPLGVTFPVTFTWNIPASNQVSLDGANVIKQMFSDCLGDDYIKLDIVSYISKPNSEVFVPHLHSVALNGWGADYGDPINFLGQECYGTDNANYSQHYSYINEVEETEATKDLLDTYKTFTKMVQDADAITDDMDARYNAFAEAEAYMIDHVLVLPEKYQIGWCLSKVDNTSKMFAPFGSANEKIKNWKTNADGYTTEDMKALAAK